MLSIYDIALSLIDSLPMGNGDCRYNAPCLIGAMLSPEARERAQEELDYENDEGLSVCHPSESAVPELRALCRQNGPTVINQLQEAHDSCLRDYETPEIRRQVLRMRVHDLRAQA